MAEKHLYFCNILVSRWVNALGSHGARLQFSLRSGMDHSVVSSSDQALVGSVWVQIILGLVFPQFQ